MLVQFYFAFFYNNIVSGIKVKNKTVIQFWNTLSYGPASMYIRAYYVVGIMGKKEKNILITCL